LASLFPDGWDWQARETGAIERKIGIKAPETLLRLFLLHIGRGYSLRETSVRAKESGLAKISDVRPVEETAAIRRLAALVVHPSGSGEWRADAQPDRTGCGADCGWNDHQGAWQNRKPMADLVQFTAAGFAL